MLNKPPGHLVSFDPGKATGWAVFIDGLPTKHIGILRGLDALDEFLADYVANYGIPDVIVYEGFILYNHKAKQQSGSRMDASQAIGKITFWAKLIKVPTVVRQDANILPIAIKWSKLTMPGDHDNSHHISAYNHGWYYLVKNGMQLPTGMG